MNSEDCPLLLICTKSLHEFAVFVDTHELKRNKSCYAGSKRLSEFLDTIKYCFIEQYPKRWYPPFIKKFNKMLDEKGIKIVKYMTEISGNDFDIISENSNVINELISELNGESNV